MAGHAQKLLQFYNFTNLQISPTPGATLYSTLYFAYCIRPPPLHNHEAAAAPAPVVTVARRRTMQAWSAYAARKHVPVKALLTAARRGAVLAIRELVAEKAAADMLDAFVLEVSQETKC